MKSSLPQTNYTSCLYQIFLYVSIIVSQKAGTKEKGSIVFDINKSGNNDDPYCMKLVEFDNTQSFFDEGVFLNSDLFLLDPQKTMVNMLKS